jgi:para-aminobenzoate synthetase component I
MIATAQLIPIPYYANSANWFRAVRHLPFAIWLDSGRPQSLFGRFDILSAAPSIWFETRGSNTYITQEGTTEYVSVENPFKLLAPYLIKTTARSEVPFTGGILGYFGYDLCRRLEKLPTIATQDIAIPDMCVGIYPWAIVQDHDRQAAWLVINKSQAPTYDFSEIERITKSQKLTSEVNKKELSFYLNKFKADLHKEDYNKAIEKILSYIRAGDCYQVNFAQGFSAQYQGDSFSAYLKLREALPSPFSAYMQVQMFNQGTATKKMTLLSLSPERFIKLSSKFVETKPIKGTIARGQTKEQDEDNAFTLENSVKDRAENLMIVDLLRNDLSKTCTNVETPELFKLQSFANVHHLVSTVTGQLKEEYNALDLLETCFPGGSITGAPKIRAMEIIEELEPTRRSVYCGSIGYISSCGNMDTNIAIRTLVCDEEKIYCWGGGGITADSNTEQEYQESIAKVKVLMDTLEQHFSPSNQL